MFSFKFHWSLILRIQPTRSRIIWFDALSQWWPSSLAHMCVTRLQYINVAYAELICYVIAWPEWRFPYVLFRCDQAALRTLISVCLSVCLSVRPSITHFWQCSCHRITLKFSGVIIIDRRDGHAKGQCQRSTIKVADVMTPFSRFRTVTPVWIHIWWWNHAQSLMLLRRGALLFFKVIRQISRSHG